MIDDDVTILDQVKEMIEKLPGTNLVLATTEVTDLFSIIDKIGAVHVVLLDINMPIANGFDIAQYIKDKSPLIKIIFMSAHPDFALQGYKYYPEDFLTKPINLVRFKQTLERIQTTGTKRKKIGVKEQGRLRLVDTSLILYIERKGKKTLIHLDDQSFIACSESLNRLEDMLNEEMFYRTHQSYLVPIDKIEMIEQDAFMKSYNVQLKNCQTIINLSRHKYSQLKFLMASYF
ncbi:response regulator transcription factor [Bacillus sp. BHET2]|uniref:LytR/AlgR family response regulator transcription factor n=1 Tax=Bacillus sp. BHET2 TaxID=2583818 RepID=UPI00110F11BD|nr:LytTR family DNA-binding domain-containing protein [Bacillus sp. BHET2]TMU83463.1 response regulator transcription factor [Bacillus sp. BHET2]